MLPLKHTPAKTIIWLLDFAKCDFWLDGGWGVDALLKRQTRPHSDIDIVIEKRQADMLVPRLYAEGFVDVPCNDTRACNFVLTCEQRGTIDFHLVIFDKDGNGLYGWPEPEGIYPKSAFAGRGEILGSTVKCMSVAFQIESHDAGYSPQPKDIADMNALARAFSVPLPDAYSQSS